MSARQNDPADGTGRFRRGGRSSVAPGRAGTGGDVTLAFLRGMWSMTSPFSSKNDGSGPTGDRSHAGATGFPGVGAVQHTDEVDVVAELVAPCPAEELFAWVADLGRYPRWLEIVTRAEPLAEEGDGAWAVDLRGRLGPLARSKRLRMVRTRNTPMAASFERRELDGRDHSPWVLDADVAPHPDGSELRMRLHYGGGLFGPVLERILRDEIERSRQRLLDLVS